MCNCFSLCIHLQFFHCILAVKDSRPFRPPYMNGRGLGKRWVSILGDLNWDHSPVKPVNKSKLLTRSVAWTPIELLQAQQPQFPLVRYIDEPTLIPQAVYASCCQKSNLMLFHSVQMAERILNCSFPSNLVLHWKTCIQLVSAAVPLFQNRPHPS